jgi:hypothetical protein
MGDNNNGAVMTTVMWHAGIAQTCVVWGRVHFFLFLFIIVLTSIYFKLAATPPLLSPPSVAADSDNMSTQ